MNPIASQVRAVAAAMALVWVLAWPSALAAQICAGSTARAGQVTLSASGTVGDLSAFGIDVGVFPTRSFFLKTGFRHVTFGGPNETGNAMRARLGFQFEVGPMWICPDASTSVTWVSAGEPDGRPVLASAATGVSIGAAFGSSLLVVPYASAAGVSRWTKQPATIDGVYFDGFNSRTGVAITAGLHLGSDRFLAGPSGSVLTLEGAGPVVTIRAIYLF